MKSLFLIGLVSVMTACGQMNHKDDFGQQQTQEETYWVNSWQRTCQGVGERLCLQVQKVNQSDQEQPDIKNWQLFYAPIEGFDYQLGNLYQIKVKATQLPVNQVPADASSIRYELIEILKKKADNTIRLHDIWALIELNGQSVQEPSPLKNRRPQPSIEFNLNTMRVHGSDGCNRFFGPIDVLGQGYIQWGQMLSTLTNCLSIMQEVDRFNKALYKVDYYELSGLILSLLDDDKTTLLKFKKVD